MTSVATQTGTETESASAAAEEQTPALTGVSGEIRSLARTAAELEDLLAAFEVDESQTMVGATDQAVAAADGGLDGN